MQVRVWDPCVVTLPAVCFRHVLWAVCSYASVYFLSREPIGVDTGKGMPGAQELCQTLKS